MDHAMRNKGSWEALRAQLSKLISLNPQEGENETRRHMFWGFLLFLMSFFFFGYYIIEFIFLIEVTIGIHYISFKYTT